MSLNAFRSSPLRDLALASALHFFIFSCWVIGVAAPLKTLVTASYDHTARLWDVASGKELRTLHGHAGGVVGAQFSANGRTVVTASLDRTARLWDVATGKELQARCGPAHAVASRRLQLMQRGRSARVVTWEPWRSTLALLDKATVPFEIALVLAPGRPSGPAAEQIRAARRSALTVHPNWTRAHGLDAPGAAAQAPPDISRRCLPARWPGRAAQARRRGSEEMEQGATFLANTTSGVHAGRRRR